MTDDRARRSSTVQLLGWTAAAAAAAAVGAAIASALYQRGGDRRDRRRFPPPGQLVDTAVGPRHVWTFGDGRPVVVVVPCLGGPAIEWTRVARELAGDATVVIYDRAGFGWSPVAGRSTSAGDMATELRAVLNASGVNGPYLLVGHSIGGLVARLFATRHRDDVAGVVLVDSSHERMDERIEEVDPAPWWALHRRWHFPVRDRLRWLGLRRLLYNVGHRPNLRSTHENNAIPADLLDAAVALTLSTSNRRADVAEMAGLYRGFAEVIAEVQKLGDLPLAVITGGPGRPGPGDRTRFHSTWLELQAELVAQSNRSWQVRADHAGHHVHRDDPELVVRVIREALEEVGR